MRRIIYHGYGDPIAVLTQIDEPTPSPGDGEVLVDLAVRPVHSGDILMVTGTHDPVQRPVPPEDLRLVAREPESSRRSARCRSIARLRSGSSRLLLRHRQLAGQDGAAADTLMLVPPDVDDNLSAQLSVNPITALLITRVVLEIARNRPGGVLRLSAAEKVLTEVHEARDDAGIVILSGAGSIVAKLLAAMLRRRASHASARFGRRP